MADLSGKGSGEMPKLDQRKFTEVDVDNFDSFLGRVEEPDDAGSDVRFYFQTKPVVSASTSRGWIIALVISAIGAVGLVGFGVFALMKLGGK
jgi:hypothetical protein